MVLGAWYVKTSAMDFGRAKTCFSILLFTGKFIYDDLVLPLPPVAASQREMLPVWPSW